MCELSPVSEINVEIGEMLFGSGQSLDKRRRYSTVLGR